MKELKDLTASEVFEEIKAAVEEVSLGKLDKAQWNLLSIIESGLNSGQSILVEKAKFMFDNVIKEKFLVENGINKTINKEDLTEIIDALERKNDKNILFIEMEYFPRIIPAEIVERVKMLKENNIFDKYFVLYTDYTYGGSKHMKQNSSDNEGGVVDRDPILFGSFVKKSEIDKNIDIMGDKLYVIGDWEDEYCDITLDKIVEIMPEKVQDIDNNVVDLANKLIKAHPKKGEDKRPKVLKWLMRKIKHVSKK